MESRPTTVVAIGDSITYGFGLSDRATQAWPALLSGADDITVVNEGITGNTTEDMLARFDRDVIARSPDAVIILGGVNDLKADIPVEDIEANIDRMVDMATRARDPSVRRDTLAGRFVWTRPQSSCTPGIKTVNAWIQRVRRVATPPSGSSSPSPRWSRHRAPGDRPTCWIGYTRTTAVIDCLAEAALQALGGASLPPEFHETREDSSLRVAAGAEVVRDERGRRPWPFDCSAVRRTGS